MCSLQSREGARKQDYKRYNTMWKEKNNPWHPGANLGIAIALMGPNEKWKTISYFKFMRPEDDRSLFPQALCAVNSVT